MKNLLTKVLTTVRPVLGPLLVLFVHVGLNLAGYHLTGYLFLLVTAMVFTYDSL